MHVHHVSHAPVGPAARVVHQSRRVELLEPGDVPPGVVLAPSLVERHPHHDRGVVAQRVHHAPQLVVELPLALGRIVVAARHVLPHQEPERVAVEIPALRLDLHVLADQVEAEPSQREEVEAARVLGRGGIQPVGPPPLVEGAELEQRSVVEEQAVDARTVPGDGDLPHPEIAADGVAARHTHAHSIEEGIARRPEPRMGDGERDDALGGRVCGGNRHGAIERRHVNARPLPATRDGDAHFHRTGVHVGRDHQAAHVLLRHGFQPHGLPDAGHGRVPDALGLPDLLPAGLRPTVGRIPHAHHQVLRRPRAHRVGDVEGERVVAATMHAELPAVDEDRGFPVHRPEVEQEPSAALQARRAEGPVVPEARAVAGRAPHAAQLRLDGEGDQDPAVPGGGLRRVLRRQGIVPEAVETLPRRARHLWPWILRKDSAGPDVVRPPRDQGRRRGLREETGGRRGGAGEADTQGRERSSGLTGSAGGHRHGSVSQTISSVIPENAGRSCSSTTRILSVSTASRRTALRAHVAGRSGV